MNVRILTIPHKKQRYETVGDWIVVGGKLKEIRVSDMKNEDYAFFIGAHEFIESHLCLAAGISQKEVDNFDKEYENSRERGITARCGCKPTKKSEPGDDRHCPYGKYHRLATKIEKMLVKARGLTWKKYDETVVNL